MSTRAPFWQADPRVWPLAVEAFQKAYPEGWPDDLAVEDLHWMVDQVRVGRRSPPTGRELTRRWGWTRHRVRMLLLRVDPFDHASTTARPQPDHESTSGERMNADNDCGSDHSPTTRRPQPDHESTHARSRQSTEHRAQSTELPPQPPKGGQGDDDAIPAAVRKAARGRVPARELLRAVADCLEVIRGKPGAPSTAAKPVLALWAALDHPPLDRFVDDLRLVGIAAHECPDRLFARDIRAEGWPEGTNRSRDARTICVQDRWDARLETARVWDRAGRPVVSAGNVSTTSRVSWLDQLRAPAKPPRILIEPSEEKSNAQ